MLSIPNTKLSDDITSRPNLFFAFSLPVCLALSLSLCHVTTAPSAQNTRTPRVSSMGMLRRRRRMAATTVLVGPKAAGPKTVFSTRRTRCSTPSLLRPPWPPPLTRGHRLTLSLLICTIIVCAHTSFTCYLHLLCIYTVNCFSSIVSNVYISC